MHIKRWWISNVVGERVTSCLKLNKMRRVYVILQENVGGGPYIDASVFIYDGRKMREKAHIDESVCYILMRVWIIY
jgi:hypothetical protein